VTGGRFRVKGTTRLTWPSPLQSVKQGESKEVTIGIKRGTNFSQDVGLRFVDLPTGG
jgi:hypothetical protein